MQSNKTVLVVDDDESVCMLLRAYITKFGMGVVTAHDGKEALEKISEQKPDIIILDIMMPVMNGYEFAGKAKQLDHYKDIPIIFLSALREQEHKDKAFACGASAYLTKPVERDILIKTIQQYC